MAGNYWENINPSQFGFGDGYEDTESNVLGQNLSPINSQGNMSSLDGAHDDRDPFQLKQDAQQANKTATNAADEDENYITSTNGNKYEKVDNSKWGQSMNAAATFMSEYLASGGNGGQAAKAAGQVLYNTENKAHRLSQVDKLEEQGFNPLDIQNWINSGDKKDLVTNKGSWTSGGNGTMFNTLTGETRQISGSVNLNVPSRTIDAGDREILIYPDGKREEVRKGASPSSRAAQGGGISFSGAPGAGSQPQIQTDENGNTYYFQPFSNGKGGKWVPYSASSEKRLDSQRHANDPDPAIQQQSADLRTIDTATDDQIDKFTGQYVGRNSHARDYLSSQDPDVREVYNAGERITGQLGNQAIGAAKSAGASGINTEAEFQRFSKSVPQIDYTSVANYRKSIEKIHDFADNFRDNLIKSKGGTVPERQQTKSSTKQGVTHVERDANGNLRIVGG